VQHGVHFSENLLILTENDNAMKMHGPGAVTAPRTLGTSTLSLCARKEPSRSSSLFEIYKTIMQLIHVNHKNVSYRETMR
jgi:hypothetical protein